ncbi:MAG: hypothetical protein OXC63_01975, partial [Aestuariivita sp.]|nr:hypothetical protein [Aestuariivita sp.]
GKGSVATISEKTGKICLAEFWRSAARRRAALGIAVLVVGLGLHPAFAQVSVTTDGLIGPPACAARQEIKSFDVGALSDVTSTSAQFRTNAYSNLYGALRNLGGDGGGTSFRLAVAARHGQTNALASNIDINTTIDSSNPNLADGLFVSTPGLSEKTPYIFEVYVLSGLPSGANDKLIELCFMTGGTYTMAVAPGNNETTNGCFSISPRTPQDVRNCWCGRKTNLPLFSGTSTPTQAAFRQSIGCKD